MLKALRQDLRTVVVAVISAAVVAGPSAAAGAYVANADKVDNKHAVGAGATVSGRAGKLVATNASGLLPNNILAQALDADRLDGLDSGALQRRVSDSCPLYNGITGVQADGTVNCAAFLPSNGTAVNADAVGGRTAEQLQQRVATASAAGTAEVPFHISPTSPTQLVQVTLVVPRAGTVQVEAVAALFINKVGTGSSSAQVGIGRSDQAFDFTHAGAAFWTLGAGTPAAFHENTLPTSRTFTISQAGSYTFQVMAQGTSPTQLRSAVVNASFTPS